MELEDVLRMDEDRYQPFEYLSDFGSLQTRLLNSWNRTCTVCEEIRNTKVVRSLEDLCLRAVVTSPRPDLNSNLPSFLYKRLLKAAVMYGHGAVPDILKAWPNSYLSLVDIVSGHKLQCYSRKELEEYGSVLLHSFLKLLQESDLTLEVLDLRGAVYSIDDYYGAGEDIRKAVNLTRRRGMFDGVKKIMMDINIIEEAHDESIRVLQVEPEEDDLCPLEIHLCHIRFDYDVRNGDWVKETVQSTSVVWESESPSSLQSLCFREAGMTDEHLEIVLHEILLPKYQNLFALNISGNQLDLLNSESTADLFIRCLGSLPKLCSLNLSYTNLTGKLHQFLEVCKNGLQDLRVKECNLNTSDLIYLMNSPHSGSLLVFDISRTSFDRSLSLETFFPAFRALVGVEVDDVVIKSGNLNDLISGFQGCKSLHYISLCGTVPATVGSRELKTALQELRLCESLELLALRIPERSIPDDQRKNLEDTLTQLIFFTKKNRHFRVKLMDIPPPD